MRPPEDPLFSANGRRELTELCRAAALEAGAAILEVYAASFDVRHKPDSSPVTEADEAAERIILAALRRATPDIPVIAEEEAAKHGLPPEPPPCFWLVDPLDGTREFIARNGEFTVNIGLIAEHRPILGIVHVPVTGVTYAGCGAGTATRQAGKAAPVPIAVRLPPPRGAVVVHSRSHGNREPLDRYVETLPGAERLISGSSVKFCLLAAGEADYYPRFGPTMEWDTAAGHAVLDAAGGSVVTWEGAPFLYGKPGFLNGEFVARGRTP